MSRAILAAPLNHANRALAKVGLSFLAHCLGATVVRSPLFHPVRRAVLNNAPPPKCMLDLQAVRRAVDAPDQMSDGEALAIELFERREDASALSNVLLQQHKHVLVLGASRHGLFAFHGFVLGECVCAQPQIGQDGYQKRFHGNAPENWKLPLTTDQPESY